MCPACIGSTLLLLGGAGSAGGLALVASRIFGAKPPASSVEDSESPDGQVDQKLRPENMSTS
jgi:hypothetical protein